MRKKRKKGRTKVNMKEKRKNYIYCSQISKKEKKKKITIEKKKLLKEKEIKILPFFTFEQKFDFV